MHAFRSPKRSLFLPAALTLALTLACSRFPLGGSPIPGPSTVAAALTGTHVAGEGQGIGPTASPTPGETATPAPTDSATATATAQPSATAPQQPDEVTPPASSPTAPVVDGAARPRLAAGQPANLVRLNMLDAANGWAVGHAPNDPSHYILRTADGGATWLDVSPPIPSGTPWAATAYFLDGQRAWATFADAAAPPLTDEPAVVWRTEDGGRNWTPSQPLNLSGAEHSAPSDLLFVDTLRGWLLTHIGVGMSHDYVMLFTTGDGGQTWERIADPLSTAPANLPMTCTKNGLGFISAETGWVTGDCHGVAPGVYFHRSDDGGRSWQPVPLPPPPGAADMFTNQTVGCGTYSLTLLPPQTVAVAVLCQDFINADLSGWLYRSVDGGQNWDANAVPGRELFFLNPDLVWSLAFGDVNDPQAARQLYRSDDGGQSWSELNTVNWSAQFDFVDPNLGWAVATAGEDLALVHSTDGGATWQLLEPTIGAG